jgi:hypothetical protein
MMSEFQYPLCLFAVVLHMHNYRHFQINVNVFAKISLRACKKGIEPWGAFYMIIRLGIFGFLGRVVASHPSKGSLSSRLILHDRAGEWRGLG